MTSNPNKGKQSLENSNCAGTRSKQKMGERAIACESKSCVMRSCPIRSNLNRVRKKRSRQQKCKRLPRPRNRNKTIRAKVRTATSEDEALPESNTAKARRRTGPAKEAGYQETIGDEPYYER